MFLSEIDRQTESETHRERETEKKRQDDDRDKTGDGDRQQRQDYVESSLLWIQFIYVNNIHIHCTDMELDLPMGQLQSLSVEFAVAHSPAQCSVELLPQFLPALMPLSKLTVNGIWRQVSVCSYIFH